jgi:GrpB-like predicted nucleotidyltransferase (UPF0157 family)
VTDSPGATDYVQPPVAHDATIQLADPDPRWPDQYAAQARLIREALGDRVLTLEHVGSTSIPGLAAKPVIDILLLVSDPADESAYVPALEQAGFALHAREPDWQEHRVLKGVDPAVNLHVFASGSPEAVRLLLFRDRLRTHPEELELYARTKRELAARRWTHVQDYADAKSQVVEGIIARARNAAR